MPRESVLRTLPMVLYSKLRLTPRDVFPSVRKTYNRCSFGYPISSGINFGFILMYLRYNYGTEFLGVRRINVCFTGLYNMMCHTFNKYILIFFIFGSRQNFLDHLLYLFIYLIFMCIEFAIIITRDAFRIEIAMFTENFMKTNESSR